MEKTTLKRSAIGLALGVVLGAGYELGAMGVHSISEARALPAENQPLNPASLAPVAAPAGVQAALPDFQAIISRAGPAVVNISVEGTVKTAVRGAGPQLDPQDPLAEFFRRFGPRVPLPQGGEQVVRGQGSGFIVSTDGLILTNAHVVAEASEVTVKLTDKREFKAKVLGLDKPTDVAVLKIEASGLPTLPLGNPENARVGEWVLAIGSPFGFENSVTAGIISAKSRSLPDEGYVPFIQTDVAINPGNSGGPLLNLRGEVVGINSQIYSRSGGYQGLSFAIPINVAAKVKEDIVAHGKVTRGRIGVAIQDVNQALAESFGLPRPEGALVSSVEKGSPGDKAGLKAGDVILGLNGTPVRSSAELPPKVADVKPGASIKLQVWRKGKTQDLEITVGEHHPEAVAAAQDTAAQGRLGLAVRPLSPEEQRQIEGPGLLVLDTAGAAARAGIQPGDVILSLNGTPVRNVEELRALVAKADHHVALLIQREDAKIFIPVNLG
ncbi:MAG: DegQ family serine endoprotease [Rhodocyclaceae bacterium]|jgi:serine protease Do|nr:DegQ family serine endoprotease [Rhodocyclaceae bacterium]